MCSSAFMLFHLTMKLSCAWLEASGHQPIRRNILEIETIEFYYCVSNDKDIILAPEYLLLNEGIANLMIVIRMLFIGD